MDIDIICVLISSLSFFAYAFSYFTSSHMKEEFKRFDLEKLGPLIIVLELSGATGLIIGLKYNLILTISSGGLALLMLFGSIVRIKLRDSIWVSLPALFFMGLNVYIFLASLN